MTQFKLLSHQCTDKVHRFEVSFAAELLEHAFEQHLQDLKPGARLPGFRQGRVPTATLRRHHGTRLRREILERQALIAAHQLIQEHHLQPVSRPRARIADEAIAEQPPAPGGQVTITVEIETLPEMELLDLEGLQLQRKVTTSKEANADLEHLSEQLLRRQLFDLLDERHPFAVSERSVQQELERLQEGYRQQLGEDPDAETLAALKQIAHRRIRLAIVLTQLGKKLQIQVSRKELAERVQAQAERSPEHRRALEDYYLAQPAALAELQAPVFEERVVAAILARCRIETVQVDAATLLAETESGPN